MQELLLKPSHFVKPLQPADPRAKADFNRRSVAPRSGSNLGRSLFKRYKRVSHAH